MLCYFLKQCWLKCSFRSFHGKFSEVLNSIDHLNNCLHEIDDVKCFAVLQLCSKFKIWSDLLEKRRIMGTLKWLWKAILYFPSNSLYPCIFDWFWECRNSITCCTRLVFLCLSNSVIRSLFKTLRIRFVFFYLLKIEKCFFLLNLASLFI